MATQALDHASIYGGSFHGGVIFIFRKGANESITRTEILLRTEEDICKAMAAEIACVGGGIQTSSETKSALENTFMLL
jgi:hypothetical protein